MNWILLMSSAVFARVKANLSDKLKAEYGMTDKNFSAVDGSNAHAVFPFVYVHMLPGIETAMDLERTTINGGLFTFQIEVYDNQSASRARHVMSEIVSAMKKMSFEITSMPEMSKTDVHRCVARFRRNISKNDVL